MSLSIFYEAYIVVCRSNHRESGRSSKVFCLLDAAFNHGIHVIDVMGTVERRVEGDDFLFDV